MKNLGQNYINLAYKQMQRQNKTLSKCFLNTKNNFFGSLGTFWILSIILIISSISTNTVQAQHKVEKIVIDAGHGGKDPGASGRYSKEKDVTLAIALATGKLLKKQFPEIKIIYTRKTDVFIPLKKRAEIANKAKADLFISIHCNANKSSSPHGSETYVMGLHRSEANLKIAKKENAAILFEDNYENQYDGFDPTSSESHIIFNLFQNTFQAHNLDFAGKLQHYFDYYTPLNNRGVKQAGFWVLYKTTMPGVLIETGFLSNAHDEKFLTSKKGQTKISRAIVLAVSDYKNGHDASEQAKQKHKPNTAKDKQADTKVVVADKGTKQNTVFKIQFLSLSTQKSLSGKKYKALQPIDSYYYKNMWRYTTGNYKTQEEAEKQKRKIRKQGFKGAFVVEFKDGKRVK